MGCEKENPELTLGLHDNGPGALAGGGLPEEAIRERGPPYERSGLGTSAGRTCDGGYARDGIEVRDHSRETGDKLASLVIGEAPQGSGLSPDEASQALGRRASARGEAEAAPDAAPGEHRDLSGAAVQLEGRVDTREAMVA